MMISMRKIRRTAAVLLCAGMIWACPLFAGAVTVDYERTGALDVRLEVTAERSDWSNVEFSLYRIGDIVNENGGVRYVANEQYAASGVELNFTTGQEAEKGAQLLQRFIQEWSLSPQSAQRTDASGSALFAELEAGVYFVQITDGQGWLTALPFVVAVPRYKSGALLYAVTANPKHTLCTPPPSPSPSPTPPPSNIPQTGVLYWPIVALSAGGCLAILLGVLLVAGKRKGKRGRE